jgi:hypothetical protein
MVSVALWLALASGPKADVPRPGDAAVVESQQIIACESGGFDADSCSISCHVVFSFYTKSCNVSCRSGYFACCNCNGGCQCEIDHEVVYALPPPPDPPPPPPLLP